MSILVVEHKTSSEDVSQGSVYWQKLQLDAQVSNYIVGARSLGYEPDGVLYDVLRKPDIEPLKATPIADRKYTKPTKKDPESRLYANQRDRDETPDEYYDRCIATIAKDPDKYLQRGIVVRLSSEEADAAYDMWHTGEAIQASRAANRWPRNVDACANFHRLCDYWIVCTGQTEIEDPLHFVHEEKSHSELDGKHHLPMLTTSSARTFRSCPRKYFFSYELGRKARSRATALSFGSVVHAALESWLQAGIDSALVQLVAINDPYLRAKAEAMVRAYDLRWRDEPLKLIATEKEFVADLVDPETGTASEAWVLAGKLDALVERQG